MQRALIAFFRCLPLWLPYGVMALVIPFYMLFGKGFRTSYRFFRKRILQKIDGRITVIDRTVKIEDVDFHPLLTSRSRESIAWKP